MQNDLQSEVGVWGGIFVVNPDILVHHKAMVIEIVIPKGGEYSYWNFYDVGRNGDMDRFGRMDGGIMVNIPDNPDMIIEKLKGLGHEVIDGR